MTTTEQDLRQRFAPAGIVEAIRIMTDRETRRMRGRGCVEMPDRRAAQRALDARIVTATRRGRRAGRRLLPSPQHGTLAPRRRPGGVTWDAAGRGTGPLHPKE